MDALTAAYTWLDYAAVAVFGATGALAAARQKHDIITFGFFAAVTGVGGGTLRDLLIEAPVFWVQRPDYIIACLVAALAVWVFGSGQARMARFAAFGFEGICRDRAEARAAAGS